MEHQPGEARVAYFSMEIALDPAIPTYAGGLGILAGDMLRSAADLGVPMVAVTLIHRKGYFRQRLDEHGNQKQEPASWMPEAVLEPVDVEVPVTVEGRQVLLGAWRYSLRGITGHVVPVYLLDAALPPNDAWDQRLTDFLYSGDNHYRLCQEVLLGLGGVEMLDKLGYTEITSYHMNEGHSALLALALIEEQLRGRSVESIKEDDMEAVRRQCIFTTHTPVPAGHDQYDPQLARQVLGDARTRLLEGTNCCHGGMLNMTYLALRCSHYINGVAMRHGEVSRGMYPRFPIHAITNGVHAVTWTSPPFQELYDRHIPEWRHDNLYLRYAIGISLDEIRAAHLRAKRALLEEVTRRTGVALDEAILTIGFARRATTYKRADLLFSNLERLRTIARLVGPMQVVYGGKAHPDDEGGKALIRRVFEAAAALHPLVRVIYVEDYDMAWAKLICAGVDLWLNTPKRPEEASGTSGMKAALNGVPSFSVPDGWWIEGCLEGVTGWAIGRDGGLIEEESSEVASLYDKLERVILPVFYGQPTAYAEVMRSAIALNGSFFNTERMVTQYQFNAYFPEEPLERWAPNGALAARK
ncbi:MAG TPA: alpha-glucan family phosphorylase [Bryobacterales bacterium]|nr:alpha-glucan family phosphorylase [Bryobacterales bacterium]